MSNIFISYSHRDEVFARLLASDLDKSGATTTWIDISDIAPGNDWRDAIESALKSAEVLLLIISPDSINSVYVQDEWERMLQYKKAVIPIMWRKTDNLPRPIERIKWIDFAGLPYDTALSQLVNYLRLSNSKFSTLMLNSQRRYSPYFQTSSEIVHFETLLEQARTIHLLAVSGKTIFFGRTGLFQEKLEEGCEIDLLIANPDSMETMHNLKERANWSDPCADAHETLRLIKPLMKDFPQSFNVRFLDYAPLYSIQGVNFDFQNYTNGQMRLSYYSVGENVDQRPYIYLAPRHDAWFKFYVKQFAKALKGATPFTLK